MIKIFRCSTIEIVSELNRSGRSLRPEPHSGALWTRWPERKLRRPCDWSARRVNRKADSGRCSAHPLRFPRPANRDRQPDVDPEQSWNPRRQRVHRPIRESLTAANFDAAVANPATPTSPWALRLRRPVPDQPEPQSSSMGSRADRPPLVTSSGMRRHSAIWAVHPSQDSVLSSEPADSNSVRGSGYAHTRARRESGDTARRCNQATIFLPYSHPYRRTLAIAMGSAGPSWCPVSSWMTTSIATSSISPVRRP